MSQDPFNVRRQTLGGINYNSAIPQPASALKRPAPPMVAPNRTGARHSLAPSRPNQPLFHQRTSSSGNNVAEFGLPSAAKRTSIMNSGGRKSFAPQAGGSGRPSQEERRSSIYKARSSSSGPNLHQSFFQSAPPPAGVPRDPRPLKDRAYQAKIGGELLQYMSENNFDVEMKHMLSQNTMRSPTQKDFNYMFQWLYHRIDPSYRFLKNIDQEVPPILKQLRYPFEKSITKSQIAAVGGQNWSTFLGLLHWMMQLAQMLEGYTANRYDGACIEAGVDVSGDRIIFDFLRGAYSDWLQMDEEADDDDQDRVLAPHVDNMARQFEESNAKYQEDLEMLEANHERLRREMDEVAKATPDIESLDKHFKILQEDRVKFEGYDEKMGQKCEKYEARINLLQEELDKVLIELNEAEDERQNLQRLVDEQGISMQDIDRMTSERERLQKGIEVTSTRLEEAKKKVAEREMEASTRLDELERLVENYNSIGYQIGIIPSTAANSKGKDFELQVLVNEGPNFADSRMGNAPSESDRLLADPVSGYQPHQILSLDLRGHIRTSFIQLKKDIAERRMAMVDTMMKNTDLLDDIKGAIEDKRGEVQELEHRVRVAQEDFEKLKETMVTQKMASDTQIEKMEKELAKMRGGLSESVQLMEQREMNANIEYEQLKLRADVLREELHTETDKMIQEIIKFKLHVQNGLVGYEEVLAEEVDKEFTRENDDTQDMDMD